jgi:hypothetical protein
MTWLGVGFHADAAVAEVEIGDHQRSGWGEARRAMPSFRAIGRLRGKAALGFESSRQSPIPRTAKVALGCGGPMTK